MLADTAHQAKARVEVSVVHVVEKYTADAARLVAVANEKVFIAPTFVAQVALAPERFERLPARAMEVYGILSVAVVGREIHAAAEPPHCGRAGFFGHETAH